MTTNKLKEAKECFYKKEYEPALEIFLQEKCFYEAGLCYLLKKDTKNAKKYWNMTKKTSPASQWGLCVLKLIDLKTSVIPTFFQTRAFLEVYLNLFFENDLTEWIENILSCCDSLAASNPEAYKFIARALYANGYFGLAITFCKKSLKLFYADPEAFLILSQCQFLIGDLLEAQDSINRILCLIPDYYPAILFKKILQEEMMKKRKN